MNIYAVIPARGGSKSIPKKNIQLLDGKPLIAYTIEYSLKCPLITQTVVSTDSEGIAEIAKNCGAEVPFMRPGELAQDDTQDYPVLKHVLDVLEQLYKEKVDALILLRPTSPLRPNGLIERAVALLEKFPKADSIRSVASSKEHPFRQWKKEGEYIVGYETIVFESYNIPRQKLPSVYFQTGDLEAVRRETILKGSISGKHVVPLFINHGEMLDVDNVSDLKKAEKYLKEKKL